MNLPMQPSIRISCPTIDAAIDNALASKRLVGTVVMVARDGEIVYRRAAGFADREAGLKTSEDTIFRLASITKPIVTIATMRLVEQGRIGLDDPVTKWLPDFRPRLEDGFEPVILIRHLLTHTSGLSYCFERDDGPYVRAGVSDGVDQPGLSLEENLRRIASVPLLFAPGTGWQYSVSMDVLGGVIETETGKRLGEAVAELVMQPLGLFDTGFTVTDRSRLAAPYVDGSPEPKRMSETEKVPVLNGTVTFAPDRIFDLASFHSGGGGMAGTASDVLTVLETIARGGAPLLSEKTVRAMTTNQIGDLLEPARPGFGFGFGWAIVRDPVKAGLPVSPGSLQWGGVYGHHWFMDQTKKITLVGLTNTTLEGMSGQFTLDLKKAVAADL
ncbi:serine hydrolase [Neorhizobium galegae]|uniref:serine hydrolase domain-containing protein n=1 Tax=Neorhizobium galegae TaxID=399 RepID=UPI0006219740|nr:serine hydrolase domain-containing protein [Neorhizobium galegae]CDZ27605.1 Esterase EstB [Neorhizobium galegae bv. officinalis]KAA9386605.1 beta-lactamase family protein [Neorhizobium galegae]KAB1111000.1 beta-lactamase family protein [Neorhizobium galegae]MCM2498493.1 beta-lactamase family protein [Neorhizobium galegae]MCQ1772351.1 beta-lactamase family protein [Neorhizobium galegae]